MPMTSWGMVVPSSVILTMFFFASAMPLSEVYAAVEPFAHTLLSGSENRLFLLYLNDAEAFSQQYADKLLYMEKDVPRTVRTTGDASDADSLPPPEEPSVPDTEAFTRWELAELGVYDALRVTDGSGVTVAVLDSGIDRAHSAFADADIAAGYDAVAHRPGVDGDASGHGTKVAGILAARFFGAEETLGAAPGVTLYPIKVSEDGQTLYTSSLIYALHLAADAGVNPNINMSLGGYSRSEAEADAVEYAHSRGCILVAAAGNAGGDETYAGCYSYPASYDHVISVGAYGQDGLICGFSQHNDALDVVAPGEALTLVAAGSDGYVTDAGTSFACAYVSAAAALCRAVQPDGQSLDGDELAKLLGLEKPPAWIESYDISNIGADTIVGGMVVFEDGRPLKSAYKRFSIQDIQGPDDYASMAQMLERRFLRYQAQEPDGGTFNRRPDLLLIDGGQGHVATAQRVLESLGLVIPVFGMVKDDRHRTRAISSQGGEIAISSHRSVFTLVTSIQDETHRFAISYARKSHKKTAFELSLTKVEGLGEKRARALFAAFRTKKAILAASEEELCAVPGMNIRVARALREAAERGEIG